LGAVVEVTFDAAPFLGDGVDDTGTGFGEGGDALRAKARWAFPRPRRTAVVRRQIRRPPAARRRASLKLSIRQPLP
jgi:hypothetical protein